MIMRRWCLLYDYKYCQISNTSRTLAGNKIVDNDNDNDNEKNFIAKQH